MTFEYSRHRVITSLLYKFLERTGHQGISFIIQIILARLLTPSDFGVLALIVVFINVSQVFVQSGLGAALIQREDIEEVDYSSVLYLSLSIAIALYGVLFISAPIIAAFYNMPEISVIIRVLSLVLIPGAFNSVQNAKARREMLFKKLMYSTFIAAFASGITGIVLAYRGYGIWALVSQQLVNQLVICIVLFYMVKWKPKIICNLQRIKVFFSYGWKLLCSSLLETIYLNIQNLIIGRRYDTGTLGYYNRGSQFPQFIITNINSSISAIMLPTLARQQDNKKRLKKMMRRSIVTSSFAIFPLMTGLAVIANPLVSFLLTDKWLPAVPYLQIYCFVFAFYPIHSANLQAINAIGRSDVFLKLEIIKKVYGIVILSVTVIFFDSPIAIAYGLAFSTIISCFVNIYPNKKLLQYSYIEQMRDILPSMGLSLFMGLCVYMLLWLQLPALITMILQILAGAVIYISLSWLFKLECFLYLLKMLKEMRSRNKNKG